MARRPQPSDPPKHAPEPEFSRIVDVTRLGSRPQTLTIEANAAERAALARRFGLTRLDRLTAKLTFQRRGDGLIEVEGKLDAAYEQECVVTGEPLPASWRRRFAHYFGGHAPRGVEAVDPLDDTAWPEALRHGKLDAGEAAAQELAAAIDPYPRKPGY